MANYSVVGYNYSRWLSDDGEYYFLCDETHGSPVKVVDVSDLSDMHVIAPMDGAVFLLVFHVMC